MQIKKVTKKIYSFTLYPETIKQLRELAKASGASVSQVLQTLLSNQESELEQALEYLKKSKPRAK